MSGYSIAGASVGSDEHGRGGSNLGEVSLVSLSLTGPESRAGLWMARGLCLEPGADPEMWYADAAHGAGDDPSEAADPRMSENHRVVKQAQMICRRCPVRQECLDYAMTNGEAWGVWGATTPRMRARIGGWTSKYVAADGKVPEMLRPERWDGWTWIDERSERKAVKGLPRKTRRPDVKWCRRGIHEWTKENILAEKGKGDRCRACYNARRREMAARKKIESGKCNKIWSSAEWAEEYNRLELGRLSRAEGAQIMKQKLTTFERAVSRARKAGRIA
jgi:hypothetical protein